MALIKVKERGRETINLGRRNMIINGAMQISQRGTSFTGHGAGVNYGIDRFFDYHSSDGAFTISQETSVVPTDFSHALKVQTTTADSSIAAGQRLIVAQRLEGQNISHLKWGTSDAKTVTLSFYVRSSITGTHGGAIGNGSDNRNYPFTYTISSADTWERKTITIPGDTTGTWATGNGRSIQIVWGLGVGSTYSGTAGAWAAGDINSATGATTGVLGTLNATWYLTGVQLEVGDVATDFEHRSYQQELEDCMRYFFSALGDTTSNYSIFPINHRNHISTGNNGHIAFQVALPCKMRTRPTLTHNLANSNHAGSGVGANTTTWNFYYQNQGWSSYAGNGNMNTLSSGPAGNAGVTLGTYYISPAGASGDQLAIGNALQMHFSAEL